MICVLKVHFHMSGKLVNRDARTTRYSDTALSFNKAQATNCPTFITVKSSVPRTPWRGEDILLSSELKSFRFDEIRAATREFNDASVIDEGGFGCVYEGWIDENTFAAVKWGTGMAIAVKRLNLEGLQGHREWLASIFSCYFHFPLFWFKYQSSWIVKSLLTLYVQAEINYLGKLCHPYLVKLIGYCFEEEHQLLVYEFMSKGSLENLLFRSESLNLTTPSQMLSIMYMQRNYFIW